MFELRWVYVQGMHPQGSICVGENIFQKLQYRFLMPGVDAGGSFCPSSTWSEWKDVPIGG